MLDKTDDKYQSVKTYLLYGLQGKPIHQSACLKDNVLCDLPQASRKECVLGNCFLYFSSKTYVVGTQKNRLNETVLLSTQNTCLNYCKITVK